MCGCGIYITSECMNRINKTNVWREMLCVIYINVCICILYRDRGREREGDRRKETPSYVLSMTFTLWIVYALNLTKLQTDGEWRPWTRATEPKQDKEQTQNILIKPEQTTTWWMSVYAIYVRVCARAHVIVIVMGLHWVFARCIKIQKWFPIKFRSIQIRMISSWWLREKEQESVWVREKKAEIFKYILHQVQDRECARWSMKRWHQK